MAEKNVKGKTDSNKNKLLGALACIVIGIAWTAYEITRPRTEDEKKLLQEDAKIQADINRKNNSKH
ncbi:MAG: hypothetical protein WCT04_27070 [Planctomycetota bacterium]